MAAAAVGLVGLAALPAAQAETHHNLPAETVSDVVAATVTASSEAELDFTRSDISSKAGPKETGYGNREPARASDTASAERKAEDPANEPVATGKATGLSAPLAQMNVSSPFGYRINPLTGAPGEFHNGTDFASGCETPVVASASGTVTEASFSAFGYGNRVVVDHGGGLKTTYNHLGSIAVQSGQKVATGEKVAGVGTTGNSTGCHLHFEVVVDGETVDPAGWL